MKTKLYSVILQCAGVSVSFLYCWYVLWPNSRIHKITLNELKFDLNSLNKFYESNELAFAVWLSSGIVIQFGIIRLFVYLYRQQKKNLDKHDRLFI